MFLKCRSKAYIMKFDLHSIIKATCVNVRQILVLSKRRISVQIFLLIRGKQRAYHAYVAFFFFFFFFLFFIYFYFFCHFFCPTIFFFLTSKNFQSVGQLSSSCFEVFAKTVNKSETSRVPTFSWADPEGRTGGPDFTWIIDFCNVEIFRQTPSGNLDTPTPTPPPSPPEKIFWICA